MAAVMSRLPFVKRMVSIPLLAAAVILPAGASAQTIGEQPQVINEAQVQWVTLKCKHGAKKRKRPRCIQVAAAPQVPATPEPDRG